MGRLREIFGIIIMVLAPIFLYRNYNDIYLYYKYVDYTTYFEYLKAEPLVIILLLFAPVLTGICLIKAKAKWFKIAVAVIGIILIISSVSFNLVSRVGFGPGFCDGIDNKRHLDEAVSLRISTAVMDFINDSGCTDFTGLYDSLNKKLLNIKPNDPESVKILIIALHDKIYYKGSSYGPYLRKTDSYKSIYDEVKPRSTKNAVGYRIEVDDGFVTCTPVFDVKEAVIDIK